MQEIILYGICFFIVAFLYASVGHGGASGYLALMAVFGFSAAVMKPTALLLNVMVSLIAFISFQFKQSNPQSLKIKKGAHIILVGNNLGSRMMNFGHFETEMHLRYPDSMLYIRNMCVSSNTT